jgi:hypothetical protein
LTGIATDVNPLVGAGAGIQSIVFAGDGTLFGARDALFTLNPITGVAALIGEGGYSDVRGIEVVPAIPEPTTFLLMGTGVTFLVALRLRGNMK